MGSDTPEAPPQTVDWDPSEYPKLVDGVLVQDPGLKPYVRQEWPKYIDGVIYQSEADWLKVRGPKTPEELEAERQAEAEALKAQIAEAQAKLKKLGPPTKLKELISDAGA